MLHTNKTSPLANITSLVEMYRHTECTVNAAVLLYTHHHVVASVITFSYLYGEEGTSITLIMCTTNNCLVERASISLEESPKTGPYVGGCGVHTNLPPDSEVHEVYSPTVVKQSMAF